MTTEIDPRDDDAPDAAPARRIPEAVWINRPDPARGVRRAARALAVLFVLGAAALAAKHLGAEPVVRSAAAQTAARGAGDGPAGYFPAQFDQSRAAPAEQPPTF